MKHIAVLMSLVLPLAACSTDGAGTGPATSATGATGTEAPTQDAATRSTPVVVGRPARVFIFASFGKNCEAIAAPQITVTGAPTKGELNMTPGQETTIQYSMSGNCIGQKASGTGVYYIARAGASGTDRFTLQATLASGEVVSRNFELHIVE